MKLAILRDFYLCLRALTDKIPERELERENYRERVMGKKFRKRFRKTDIKIVREGDRDINRRNSFKSDAISGRRFTLSVLLHKLR